jgi:hypothetical protein
LRKILEEDKNKIEKMKRHVEIEQNDIADLMRKTENKEEEEDKGDWPPQEGTKEKAQTDAGRAVVEFQAAQKAADEAAAAAAASQQKAEEDATVAGQIKVQGEGAAAAAEAAQKKAAEEAATSPATDADVAAQKKAAQEKAEEEAAVTQEEPAAEEVNVGCCVYFVSVCLVLWLSCLSVLCDTLEHYHRTHSHHIFGYTR